MFRISRIPGQLLAGTGPRSPVTGKHARRAGSRSEPLTSWHCTPTVAVGHAAMAGLAPGATALGRVSNSSNCSPAFAWHSRGCRRLLGLPSLLCCWTLIWGARCFWCHWRMGGEWVMAWTWHRSGPREVGCAGGARNAVWLGFGRGVEHKLVARASGSGSFVAQGRVRSVTLGGLLVGWRRYEGPRCGGFVPMIVCLTPVSLVRLGT